MYKTQITEKLAAIIASFGSLSLLHFLGLNFVPLTGAIVGLMIWCFYQIVGDEVQVFFIKDYPYHLDKSNILIDCCFWVLGGFIAGYILH